MLFYRRATDASIVIALLAGWITACWLREARGCDWIPFAFIRPSPSPPRTPGYRSSKSFARGFHSGSREKTVHHLRHFTKNCNRRQ